MNTQTAVVGTGDMDITTQAFSECIKSTTQFSGTIYQNICTGASQYVAHGFWDFALAFILLGIGLSLIIGLFKIILD